MKENLDLRELADKLERAAWTYNRYTSRWNREFRETLEQTVQIIRIIVDSPPLDSPMKKANFGVKIRETH